MLVQGFKVFFCGIGKDERIFTPRLPNCVRFEPESERVSGQADAPMGYQGYRGYRGYQGYYIWLSYRVVIISVNMLLLEHIYERDIRSIEGYQGYRIKLDYLLLSIYMGERDVRIPEG